MNKVDTDDTDDTKSQDILVSWSLDLLGLIMGFLMRPTPWQVYLEAHQGTLRHKANARQLCFGKKEYLNDYMYVIEEMLSE
jgi:flagellar biosynthesis protein FliP